MSKFKPSMNILLLLLLIVIFTAYYFYIFIPISGKITKLNADHIVDASIIKMIMPFEKDDSPLRNRKEQLLKELSDNDVSLKYANASNLAQEIRAAAVFSGVKVNEVNVLEPVISQKQAESNSSLFLSSVSFNLRITGDYNGAKQFVSYFENSQGANVLVESVDISQSGTLYDFNVKFVLNYYGK